LIALVDAFAHFAFTIGLEVLQVSAQLFTQSTQAGVDFIQCDGPVLLGVALAKHVVVDAVQHENFHGLLLIWFEILSEPIR
jgi:hypothetical protein